MIRVNDLVDPAWIAPSHGCDYDIQHLERGITEAWNIDTNPPYQRGHVWTNDQRSAFLGHWLQGGAVPTLWIWEPPLAKEAAGLARPELIDGKQRLSALLMWWHGEISANVDGRMIIVGDTDKRFRFHHAIHLTFVRLDSRADVLRFYLRLNGGGTPHSPDELARVRALLDEEENKQQ
jgi:hypothetical protein